MERQRIFRRQPPPQVAIVLDECLLHHPIGGPRVMFMQLGRLVDLMKSETIEIRILPASTGAHPGQHGAFQIFDLPGPYPQAAYTETIAGPAFTASGDIHRFIGAYERLREAALDPDISAALITTAAREMTRVSTS